MMSAYKQPKPVRQKGQHLYLIQSAVTEAVKIGRSSDPHKRLRELQTGSPHRLTLLALLEDKGDLELGLHQRLDRWRLKMKGEWFSPECLPHLPDWILVKLQT